MGIGIYITSCNQKRFLREAIESALAQTLSPEEILILDDASSDGSREIIEGYAREYRGLVRAVFHERNEGIGPTRAEAMGLLRSELVTYLDGDDRLLPGKLEAEAAALASTREAGIAFSNYAYINEQGERLHLWAEGTERPPQGELLEAVVARRFPRRNLFRNELVRRAAWVEVGWPDPRLSLFEDFEMRIRLTRRLRAVYTGQLGAEYRVHAQGLHQSPPEQLWRAVRYIRRKHGRMFTELPGDVAVEFDQWSAQFAEQASRVARANGRRCKAWWYGWRAARCRAG